MITCKICNISFKNKRSLSTHITTSHKIKVIDYVVQYTYNGIRPLCSICNTETRYVSFTFKRFCTEHSYFAEREGGRKGGKAEAWNKGLTKACDTRIAQQSENMKCEKNPFYGRKHSQETIAQIKTTKLLSRSDFAKRIIERASEFILLTPYEEYFSRQTQYLEFKCKVCQTLLKRTLQTFERGTVCHICHPNTSSNAEREIYEFIICSGFNDVEANVKNIISPKELDIYVPSKNFAIEYNGLYWHMNADKDLHKTKTKLCADKDITLFHIFSDEWLQKQEICKSMIRHKLGITEKKVFARKCVIKCVDKATAKDFLNASHISGYSKCKIAFGCYHDDILVSIMSLKQPRHRSYKHTIEIARFANALNTHVVGAFSKLLSHVIQWCNINDISKIISYADLRFSTGNVYEINKFTFVRDTGLNYWYCDGKNRFDRFRFRAKNGKSEAQVAAENNVMKIYGCGNYLYEMKLTK